MTFLLYCRLQNDQTFKNHLYFKQQGLPEGELLQGQGNGSDIVIAPNYPLCNMFDFIVVVSFLFFFFLFLTKYCD